MPKIIFIFLLFCPLFVQANTIRVTLQLPETHALGQNWKEFKKIVENKTSNELKVEIFPSAQLFRDKEVPEAVGMGAIEAGSSSISQFAGFVPEVEVITIPFLFDADEKLNRAVSSSSELRQILDDEILRQTGARVLWWQAFGRNIYLSKETPLFLPNDLKGKKVRTYSKMGSWTVETLGGAPTIMSGSRQFLAYQQNVVDVGTTGISTVKARKLYEVMDHMTLTYDFAIEFLAIMNNDFFENLSAEHRQIVIEAAQDVEKKHRLNVYNSEEKIIEDLKSKINIISLSSEQRKLWKEATKPIINRFIRINGPKGKKIISTIR